MNELSAHDAAAFADCIGRGGVVVFPSDTVYGIACDPHSEAAAARLYELKGRPPAKPAAVMCFTLDAAFEAIPPAGLRTRGAMLALLPGAVTLVLPNPQRRFAPACGPDPDTLGLRVPALPRPLAPLRDVGVPVLQSSANLAGCADPRLLSDVPQSIRDRVDLVLDGGALPGTPSTVVDLRAYEDGGAWDLLRDGAVSRAEVAEALAPR